MNIKFEKRISLAYLLIGGLWIVFSDKFVDSFIEDADFLTEVQTYKGWFYVFVTAILFYLFLKKHLNQLRNTEHELEMHRNNLQQLVEEKTKELDSAVCELSATNEELNQKNNIIIQQNSDLVETLKQLNQTQSQLLQAEKMASLGILTSGISHEINNPLNYILGGLTGLENHFKTDKQFDNEEVHLFIESIKTGVTRASSIVSELNQLSNHKESERKDCSLHAILEKSLLLVQEYLGPKIEIIKDFHSHEIVVFGHRSQLHQIFINILINAGQSIAEEGSIFIRTTFQPNQVITEISDTGCGISPDHMLKITDPFFTTKAPGKGTGLGLSIAYNFINMHGGLLNFQSEPGKGTKVTVTLPAKIAAHD